MIRFVAVSALAMTVAACGKAAPESDNPDPGATPPAGTEEPATVASGHSAPPAFAQCRTCHQVELGKHGVGPSLAKIYGTKAGEIPGYTFSTAMKASNLTWDDATLDKFLEAPMKTIPGTKMVFPGLKDPAKRAEVIAYLKTI